MATKQDSQLNCLAIKPPSRGIKKGITAIIEIMIAIPLVSDTTQMQVTSAAREITSALMYAQTVSISTKDQYQVVFDTANNS